MLLDADYFIDENGYANIEVFVSTSEKIVRLIDRGFRPYFFVLCRDEQQQQTAKAILEADFGGGIRAIAAVPTEVANAQNALKVVFKNPQDLVRARETITEILGVVEKREFDIPFSTRYLIDKKLRPMAGVEAHEEAGEIVSIKAAECEHEMRIVALDLETYSPGRFSDATKDPILMAVLATKNGQKVYTYKKSAEKGVLCFANEKEMVEAFLGDLRKMQPDILVTYNGDSFDLPYVKTRCEKLKIKCDFGFGSVKIVRRGMYNAAGLKGIAHLDAFQLLKFMARIGAVSLLKFDLENVSDKVFGKPKEKVAASDINALWDSGEIDRVVRYNAEDGDVTLRLAEEFLPLQLQLCSMLRMTLYDTSRASSSQMVEQLLIINSFDRGQLIPNKPTEGEVARRNLQTYKGGFVKEPLPGLHENIAVL
ncbi:MAG: ribonuclease H-like domain-containing protein, partial [archaeon]|nr:ribonuclease H-like domain-containing protein [archaeon]